MPDILSQKVVAVNAGQSVFRGVGNPAGDGGTAPKNPP
jgi:hypothetical protein